MKAEVVSFEQAIDQIHNGASIGVQGSGGGVNEPSRLLKELGASYARKRRPSGLTMIHATGLGDKAEIGMDYLAEEGLVQRDIAGHLAMAPSFARLIRENKVESYNLPQGVISHLFAAIGGRKPGVITKVGLDTFVDPRLEAAKMNQISTEDLVQVLHLKGEEWLFYPAMKVDVALVRGTRADLDGNISMECEGAILEGINIAQAAKACGGIVIAQVKYLSEKNSIDPRKVQIPGILVDYIVVDEGQKQSAVEEYNPAFCGASRLPLDTLPPLPQSSRKIIARRAAQELYPGAVINLGVGIPDGIANIAAEKGLLPDLTFTVEQGVVGGRPAGGVIFGMSYNPDAIISASDQFHFYDGGGLDMAFLGMAECDQSGNVNVSKMGGMLTGCGGFINISQNTSKLVFCGTFTSKGLEVRAQDGSLRILQEGSIRKFCRRVEQITFSGKNALSSAKDVLYVTERAVFKLVERGLLLIEIAPGIRVQEDILSLMDFRPIVSTDLQLMREEFYCD